VENEDKAIILDQTAIKLEFTGKNERTSNMLSRVNMETADLDAFAFVCMAMFGFGVLMKLSKKPSVLCCQ
jgi:hypothetical protein